MRAWLNKDPQSRLSLHGQEGVCLSWKLIRRREILPDRVYELVAGRGWPVILARIRENCPSDAG